MHNIKLEIKEEPSALDDEQPRPGAEQDATSSYNATLKDENTSPAAPHVAFRSLVSRFRLPPPAAAAQPPKRKRSPSPPTSTTTTATTTTKHPIPKPVADLLAPNLRIVFIGFNPGTRSAATGHHYAHGGNYFWKCLSESGLTGGEIVTYNDDVRCVDAFSFGFTNIISRCTPSSTSLGAAEYATGAVTLGEILEEYTPLVACFVGFAVWEAFRAFMLKREGRKVAKEKTKAGLQAEMYGGTKLFVMPSTSGRVVGWTKEARVQVFVDLKKVVDDIEAGRHETPC
ncbi:hypothetical protein HDU86_000817 [Geranomyces michiganensis]|nr:hypothetical protein HDU86_000817 [Geranomyces michiganensis]